MKINRLPSQEEFLPTRITLLNRIKNLDDSEGWRDFFDTYAGLIFSYALRYGLTQAEAEDVVQDTVIEVSRKMPGFQYDPKRSFKGWLLNTTRWRIQDQLRKRKGPGREVSAPLDGSSQTDLVDRLPDPSGDYLEEVWEEEWQRNLMAAAIDKVKSMVKPRQYQIFDLVVIKEWPVEKVAATLKVSKGQVYLTKFRITHMLKKQVNQLKGKLG
jgi:RNA polymerase sigma factor (sigma-70 family)